MAAALVSVGAGCCASRIAIERQSSSGALCCSRDGFGRVNVESSSRRRKARLWCCNAAAASSNPDSRPDLWKNGTGYHPLEELSSAEKDENDKGRAAKLSDGEIARTIAEVNSSAILLAPSLSQSNAVYGTETPYLIDEHGDIYIEISDDNNVLQKLSMDPRCSFLIGYGEVNELLTSDLLPAYTNQQMENLEADYDEEDAFLSDDSSEEEDSEDDVEEAEADELHLHVENSGHQNGHPMLFASKLAKVAGLNVLSKVFKPSMRLAMTGVIKGLTDDEESHVRRTWDDRYLWEDEDDDSSVDEEELSEVSDDIEAVVYSDLSSGSEDEDDDWSDDDLSDSTLYKFEIHSIQLASDIGVHSSVDVKDFKYSEADGLAHAAPDIIRRLQSGGKKVKRALKNLCHREAGMSVEEAVVIGVDSLGIDVRASRGIELKTLRFSFARRARCVDTAQLLLHQLLYPRSRHKK